MGQGWMEVEQEPMHAMEGGEDDEVMKGLHEGGSGRARGPICWRLIEGKSRACRENTLRQSCLKGN